MYEVLVSIFLNVSILLSLPFKRMIIVGKKGEKGMTVLLFKGISTSGFVLFFLIRDLNDCISHYHLSHHKTESGLNFN